MSIPASEREAMNSFFKAGQYAVVGASTNRSKYGNKVLRWYQDHHLSVTPVHPHETRIEGEAAVKELADVMDMAANPAEAQVSVSIITPPAISLEVLRSYVSDLRILAFWLQPGAADGPVGTYGDGLP
ncbi:hypothetical protein MVES1_003102 [Malassezia vespertilionis]|uniref:uncharacterized protein n=1 Tax=Malassezia vespertilionis TaxID=2020962 RepID=UPI0024B13A97|nr:uncharacterized protein MVES1_003102 [Malassezia vespertilionis]WFD07732.1 hypothetical protein MVES1_003102 [Malassezia vespertilionis]